LVAIACTFAALAGWSAVATLNRPVHDRLANLHGNSAIVAGEVGPEATRLVYILVQSAAPIDVRLLPLSAPATVSASPAGVVRSGVTDVPVVDRRSTSTRRLAVAGSGAPESQLPAYDAAGRMVGCGGGELHNG
jgi:hypothetical protein